MLTSSKKSKVEGFLSFLGTNFGFSEKLKISCLSSDIRKLNYDFQFTKEK